MNIVEIADKIIRESGVNPREWTVVDRLLDIHQARLTLADLATKFSSDNNINPVQVITIATLGDSTTLRTEAHREIISIK